MKNVSLMFAAVLLVACGSDQQAVDAGSASGPDVVKKVAEGRFIATLGEREYDVPAKCLYLEKDHFSFSSRTTTGGIVVTVSGLQSLQKLMLTINDQGESFRSRDIAQWEKSANGATGSGALAKDGDSPEYELTFELKCS